MKPRLAVFDLHHLGDALLSLPFLRGASGKFRPVLACRPASSKMLAELAPSIETVPLPDGWLPRLTFVRRQIRLHPRDACACVWPDPRAHLLMLGTGAGIRAGFAVNARNFYAPRIGWRARRLGVGRVMAGLLDIVMRGATLTPPLDKVSSSQHHLASWAQLARSLGFEPDESKPWIPTESRRRSRGTSPRFVLHAGGRLPTKRWPIGRFEELLRDFFAPRGWPVTICRVPGEPFPRPMGLGQNVVETPTFRGLADILANAEALVCNDSFPGHLAAAIGKPVVAVFGSGEPAWFAPAGSTASSVVSNACPHRPCIDRCLMPSFVCLDGISTREVEVAIERVARNL